jgi:hypothetical protein
MPTSTSATCSTTWPATPKTRAILLYIESIEAPRKFMSAARAAARNKPVHGGQGRALGAGAAAAASHTGALAGSDIVFDAAIRRAGMLRVDTLQDLFTAAETLAYYRGANARRERRRGRAADAPDQRRRRRRDGRRRRGLAPARASGRTARRTAPRWMRSCRPTGRTATRSTSSATPRSSVMSPR